MRNEYGESLDRNGYAISLFDLYSGTCFVCGRSDRALQRHEIYHGAYRDKSKALGLWVQLCDVCHDRLHHRDARIDRQIKEYAQRVAMNQYGWTVAEFRKRFGKSYLEEENE
jgi:hypothetical protein